jgi:hypothetical protein
VKNAYPGSKSIFTNFDKYRRIGKKIEITKKRLSINDLKKIFEKTGCVRGKPRGCRRRPNDCLTLNQRKTVCQRGLTGFFYQCPLKMVDF